ncbi:hypothetical protein [Vibrio breoganii]|uniref:hypothetical protein n=1 Tax=Vibrio breoganii TaxID=553239 RepID=UPI0002EB3F3C|nr:hypothetical protein [Vibrio breoganii]OED96560.1 hypothetical protein A1QG_14940 [Vibrio breoganii ZF-29]PMH15917.1 hypothetical protein BCU74_13200 [Vibrio breoganii]PMK54559.1 hypothetical protein BCT98_01855 [Vibrio breoganii]PMK67954.1 hypothetical protein BCT94_02770 [Vibrio breoganii]PMM15368.1 hypothetical protein BCT60_07465 [Vibrio breoganii]
MDKHVIRLCSQQQDITIVEEYGRTFFEVPVFYKVDYCHEILSHLTKFQGDVTPNLKSELSVRRVKLLKCRTDETLICALAEAIVATDLFQLQGENIFDLNVEKPPKGRSSIVFSQLDAQKLVTNPLLPEYEHQNWKCFDGIAAYFYGADITHSSMPFALSELDSVRHRLHERCSLRPKEVKERLLVDTEVGRAMITFKTIMEYLNVPIIRKEISEDSQKKLRVFETVKSLVQRANTLVSVDNPHLVRLHKKEPRAEALFLDKSPVAFVDFIPVESQSYDCFVLGFRFLQSREKYEELREQGYTWEPEAA